MFKKIRKNYSKLKYELLLVLLNNWLKIVSMPEKLIQNLIIKNKFPEKCVKNLFRKGKKFRQKFELKKIVRKFQLKKLSEIFQKMVKTFWKKLKKF